jgi:hypothetical protein
MEDQKTDGSAGTRCVDLGARPAGRWQGPVGPDPTVQRRRRSGSGGDGNESYSQRGRRQEPQLEGTAPRVAAGGGAGCRGGAAT